MHHSLLIKAVRRRKELVFFVCALVAGLLAVGSSVSGWLEPESWGEPVTRRKAGPAGRPPVFTLPDFAAIESGAKKSPFVSAAAALEPGGRARIPPPPLPPLVVDMPPAPMVRPIDLVTEGVR